MIHHITRATQHLIFWSLIGIALFLTVFRFTLSVIDIYREDLETIISKEISSPVKIASLGAGMRGFRPELVLKQVQVLGEEHTSPAPITLQEVRLSMDLLKSFGQQQMLASSWITLVGARLTVARHTDGSITLRGLKASKAEPPLWILHTAQFEILHSQLAWEDETQTPPAHLKSPQSKTNLPPVEPLVFHDVNATLKSDQNGLRHVINVQVTPPKRYGDALSISMQLRGNFLAPQGITGLIYAEGKGLSLANLHKSEWPLNISVSSGQGNIRLWSYWQQSQLQAITGTSNIQQAVLQRPAQPPLNIKQLQNRFNWVQQNEQWQLRIDQLSIDANTLQLAEAKISLAGSSKPEHHLQSLALEIPQLNLQQAAEVAHFFNAPLPISAKALQGNLQGFTLTIVPETQQFNVQGRFNKVSLAADQNHPGIGNISGQIQGNEQQGTLTLAINNTALDMPSVFAKPLPLTTFKTTLSWQQDENDWIISAPKIAASVPDLQANGNLSLKINRKSHALWMDLHTALSGSTSIQSFARYWTTGLMSKDAVIWLNQAFPKGQVNPRSLEFSGAPADFPFLQKKGLFKLILDFKGTDLKYSSDWQPVKAIDAEVTFLNDSLIINSQQATVEGSKLKQFDIRIPSFMTKPFVDVNIKGEPDIRQTLSYLLKSPLKSNVDRLLEVITPQGPAPLDLRIQVPLEPNKTLSIQGALQLQNVRLTVLPLALPVHNVQGIIDFNAQGISGGQLQAKTLGDNIKVTLLNNRKQMQLDIFGHTNIVDLQQQFNSPAWHYARGDSGYKLRLQLPNDDGPANLTLTSDLTGITLRLPDILAKKSAESRPLSMQMTLGNQPQYPINLQLGHQFKASVLLNAKAKSLTAAELLVGSGSLTGLPAKGGELTLNLAQSHLDEWLDFTETSAANDKNPEPFFTKIQLHTPKAMWQGQSLGNLSMRMQYAAQNWQIAIDSAILKGQMQKPANNRQDQPTRLDLDFVNLSALSNLKTAEPQKPSTQQLPIINLKVKQTFWNDKDLGALNIETARILNGLRFKQFNLTNPWGNLDLSGNWLATATSQETHLSGKLKLHRLGDYLSSLKITQDLKETDAKADIDIHWPGAPQHFSLAHLQGKVSVDLNNGRILSIEPGFGRLLGFLAFEQWGRRLRLDFSDMLSKGLTFNNIHGDFDLQEGDAITNNLIVDAVPALVKIKGFSHLAEHTLDYHATVLPKSSAALPIAGTIVDRVVTFTLETVTGNAQDGFLMGSEYKILGSWQNPQVIRLRENDGLLQKTWHGLTDFSWLQQHDSTTSKAK